MFLHLSYSSNRYIRLLRTFYVPSTLIGDDNGAGGMTSLYRFDIRNEIRATDKRNNAKKAASRGGECPDMPTGKLLNV